MDSIKSKTVHGLYWSFLESAGIQGVRFIIGIILARVLVPKEFGLVGMLTIFIAVAQSMLDSGFGAALIQKQKATQLDYCSIFFFQIGIGLIIYICLYSGAPWIAEFYHQPTLAPLTRVLSLIIIINSFGWIHSTILSKEINFEIQAKVRLIAVILSGIIGVALAISGFGVWSLVAQQLLNSLCCAGLFWLWNKWRPTLIFSGNALKGMFSFGSRIFFSGILNQIYENIYYVIIGRVFSATSLGFFTRAKTFADVPSNTISVMVGRVTFPVFSVIQDDKQKMKTGLKKALITISWINFPIMICIAVVARTMILALVTEKWAASIPYLRLLIICGLLVPVHIICMDVIRATGCSKIFLRIEIIKKVLVTINIAITFRWGITAVIIGMIIVSIFSYCLSSYYVKRLIDYSFKEQIRDLLPNLLISILTGTLVYLVGWLPFKNNWGMLLLQVITGIATYLGLCKLNRINTFREIWKIINEGKAY